MISRPSLYIEHEEPRNDRKEGAFTILSTNFFPDRDFVNLGANGRHMFAILWNRQFNDRIIDVIEDMLTYDLLGPVRLLHPSGRTIIIVYAATLPDQEFSKFSKKVTELASKAFVGMWKVTFVAENKLNSGVTNERQFKYYAPGILRLLML